MPRETHDEQFDEDHDDDDAVLDAGGIADISIRVGDIEIRASASDADECESLFRAALNGVLGLKEGAKPRGGSRPAAP